MIRLQGGDYSNQGRVEVYCNGQWVQYVMMDLLHLMLTQYVNNWAIQEPVTIQQQSMLTNNIH